MKKATVIILGIFFIALTANAFAGDFAGDLKSFVKSTASAVYQATGNTLGPTLGPAVQGIQRSMYNNLAVNNYNAINTISNVITRVGIDQHINNAYNTQVQMAWAPYNILNSASTGFTGVGIDQHMTNALRYAVLSHYSAADGISTFLTGSGMGQYTKLLLPEPFYSGAEKLRLYLVNYPYAKSIQKDAPIVAPILAKGSSEEKPVWEYTLYSFKGSSEEEEVQRKKFKEQCINGDHFPIYYKEYGLIGATNQCLIHMKKTGDIKDFRFEWVKPGAQVAAIPSLPHIGVN